MIPGGLDPEACGEGIPPGPDLAEAGKGAAGLDADFESPDEAAGVLEVDLAGGLGIPLGEAFLKFREGKRFQFGSKIRIGGGQTGGQTEEHRADVESGSSHQEGAVPPGSDFEELLAGHLEVARDVEGFLKGQDSNEVRGSALDLLWGGLSREEG
jgi:hypothetical protein